ncbi:glycoside hydrolase family 13 protein [Viridothelium virens]|uniref:Glycoside hydrolase family 13 protein n=1 Tax=Viridothelium virens TaxID=1048519 RepID=A0A6A6H922_VIRVR|nr:glycoside hydrolase family 13 protein [Viridothelium virens]
MAGNPTLFQAFEWNVPADEHHWQRLRNILPQLKAIGIDNLWLPPACKGNNFKGNGYDIYDLYDLGEFHQKGSRNTKWGSKEDLIALAAEARALAIGLYFDAVLNHRCGGDATQRVKVVQVDDRDRRRNITKPYDIEAWLAFFFPGRQGKYSAFRYNWSHFNASDYDNATGKKAIFKIVADGKDWQKDVDKASHGNYDYLLLNNLDYSNGNLREEVKRWGQWVVQELGLSGFRLDAVKHFSQGFVNEWVNAVNAGSQKDLFYVGEHWTDNTKSLVRWLASAPPNFHLFDAPLLYNLARTSWAKDPDLRQIFQGTLVEARPNNAITLVMNHDTQRGQTMETLVKPTFMALAYALVLLRRDGYPCIFYGDLYGLCDPHPSPPTCWGKLPDLVLARRLYAYGTQTDYFESKNCIGWVRSGASEGSKQSGLAIVMSWQQKHPPSGKGVAAMDRIRQAFQKSNQAEPPSRDMKTSNATISQQPKPPSPRIRMRVGHEHAGQTWRDLLGWEWADVIIDSEGFGVFPCQPNSLAVFTATDAEGREKFPVNFSHNIYEKA